MTHKKVQSPLRKAHFNRKYISTNHDKLEDKHKYLVGDMNENKYSWKKFFMENPSSYAIIGMFALSLYFGNFLHDYSGFFKASVINQLPRTEFTGTVNPIKKVPNYVALTDAERTYAYAKIPKSKLINIPEYNVKSFKRGAKGYQSPAKDRNAYITYSVPYLGNYRLDGTEHSGSHPGMDIKVPIGTPVQSMASGVVYKSENQPSGFGQFISIAHVGIPDPENPSRKITLISNYAHLSQRLVKEGDLVKKGQLIGKSGNTGMATAPHLHFQVDRDNAPFHPYWPFTWKEVQSAGMSSYFEAVRQGLNKSKAAKYTVDSDKFIRKFVAYKKNTSVVKTKKQPTKPQIVVSREEVASAGILDKDVHKKPIVKNTHQQRKPEIKQKPKNTIITNKVTTKKGALRLSFETDRSFVPGEEERVKIYINDKNLIATSGILLGSTYDRNTEISPKKLKSSDFDKGYAEVKIISGSNYAFKLTADTDYGKVKSQTLKPQVFTDVGSSHPYSTAIDYLKKSNIIKGYADGSFHPDGSLNRAEALKIILSANYIKAEIYPTDLTDIATGSWFQKYVTTAVNKGIVNGYPDKTFRPGNTISRAEFLKIALLTAKIKVPSELTRDPYADVIRGQWYAPYFDIAKTHRLLRQSPGKKAYPAKVITRKEAAEIIYLLRKK